MTRQLVVLAGASCLLVASPAMLQAQTPTAPGSPAAAAVARSNVNTTAIGTSSSDYIIGPDDLLSVVFWREAQLSGEALVRPDGKISLPLLDDVQAAGLTPEQLRDRLVIDALRFISTPIATVVVKQVNSRKVYITGMVSRPGQYPLTQTMTVLQLIATAGGLQEYAKAGKIRIVRREGARTTSLRFNYEAMAKHPERASQNIELKPGDTVIVP